MKLWEYMSYYTKAAVLFMLLLDAWSFLMETLSSSLKGNSQQNQTIVGKEFIGNTQIWSGSKNIKPNLSFSKKQQQQQQKKKQ